MPLLTEKQLCEKLSVTRVFIYQQRQKGLPFIRLGQRIVRYDLDSVLAWLKENNKEVA